MDATWAAPADKYQILQECRACYLASLATLAREGGIAERDAIVALQEGVGDYFDQMIRPTRKGGFEASDGLTASRISLVPESELELEIGLGEVARRLKESQLEGLRRVYLRFVTLLNRPNLATNENPLGIDGIVEGLTQMFSRMGRGSEKSLEMLDSLETSLSRNLPAAYNQVLEVFDRHGIKPAVAKILTQNSGSGSASHPPTPTGPTNTASNAANEGSPHVSTPDLTPQLLQKLFDRLDAMQIQGEALGQVAATHQSAALNAAAIFAQMLNPFESGLPESEGPARAFERLARYFAEITAHPALPDTVKIAIGSLQPTVLKAAMLDATFFSTENHPARQFVDRMVEVSRGLLPNTDGKHPICQAVTEIAAGVCSEFKSDMRTFKHYLAELDVLKSVRDEEIAECARTYKAALDKWQRLEKARAVTEAVIAKLLTPEIPIDIADFVRYDWSRVLQLDLVEHGEGSQPWIADLTVLRGLLQSIQPVGSADERRQRIAALPTMLARFSAGFDRIKLSKAERDRFMDACFDFQTKALNAVGAALKPTRSSGYDPIEFSSTPTKRSEYQEVTVDGKVLKVWTAGDDGHAGNQTGPRCADGDWLEIRLPTGETICGRLSHRDDTATDNCLISNPEWEFGLIASSGALAKLMNERSVRIINYPTV